MKLGEAYQSILSSLAGNYEQRELKNVAHLIIEHITGFSNTERLLHKNKELTIQQGKILKKVIIVLKKNTPIQYVLQEAWFAGMKFFVNKSVLIPRPETEELVEWIVENKNEIDCKESGILDIGTGSGCIAIALKKKLSPIPVAALDYQMKIINLAKKNAAANNVEITFYKKNILKIFSTQSLPVFDIIVSNPPYVLKQEIEGMEDRVWGHEPHAALFVPDNDPLIFYKAIIDFASTHLKKTGYLFFEINPDFAHALQHVLEVNGFTKIQFKNDMQGKLRMVSAKLK